MRRGRGTAGSLCLSFFTLPPSPPSGRRSGASGGSGGRGAGCAPAQVRGWSPECLSRPRREGRGLCTCWGERWPKVSQNNMRPRIRAPLCREWGALGRRCVACALHVRLARVSHLCHEAAMFLWDGGWMPTQVRAGGSHVPTWPRIRLLSPVCGIVGVSQDPYQATFSAAAGQVKRRCS